MDIKKALMLRKLRKGYGMLTGDAITKAVELGLIDISPFNPQQVNPNSYNLRLHPELITYFTLNGEPYLDINKKEYTGTHTIPEEGFVLQPGVLYIGRTVERTSTDYFVPMINGRSSLGRYGISIHATAGFGDIGFNGTWTLEISVIQPVKIYPNIPVAQVCYFNTFGDTSKLYRGRYYKQEDATPSRFYLGEDAKYEDTQRN